MSKLTHFKNKLVVSFLSKSYQFCTKCMFYNLLDTQENTPFDNFSNRNFSNVKIAILLKFKMMTTTLIQIYGTT